MGNINKIYTDMIKKIKNCKYSSLTTEEALKDIEPFFTEKELNDLKEKAKTKKVT